MVYMKRKFTKEDLKELVTNKDNCVKQVKNGITHLSIHPSGLGNVLESVKEVLNQKITKYDQKLGGILLHYKHLKMLTNSSGRMYHYTPMIQVNIQATFYIFSPEVGQKIQATVIKKNTDHLGCMAHKLFNISVPKPANFIGKKWRGNRVKIGQTVLVEITLVDCNNTIPYIRGNLIERYYLIVQFSGLEPVRLMDIRTRHNFRFNFCLKMEVKRNESYVVSGCPSATYTGTNSVDDQVQPQPVENVDDLDNASTELKRKKHKKKNPFDMNVVNGHAAEHLKVFQQESKPKTKQRVSFAAIDESQPKSNVKIQLKIIETPKKLIAENSSPKKKPKTPKKSQKDSKSSDIDKLMSRVEREFSQSESDTKERKKKTKKDKSRSQEDSKSSDIDKPITQVEREFSQNESEINAIAHHSSVFDSSGTKERKKKAKKDKSREKTPQLDLDTLVEQIVKQNYSNNSKSSKNNKITSEKFVEKTPTKKTKSPKKSKSSENIAKMDEDENAKLQQSFDIEQILSQAEQDLDSSKKLASKSKKNKSKGKSTLDNNDDGFEKLTDSLLQSLNETKTNTSLMSKKRKRSKSVADSDISDLLAEAESRLTGLSKDKRKKRRHNDLDATFNGMDQALPSSQFGTPLFSSTIITESRKSAKKSRKKSNDDEFLDDILSKYL